MCVWLDRAYIKYATPHVYRFVVHVHRYTHTHTPCSYTLHTHPNTHTHVRTCLCMHRFHMRAGCAKIVLTHGHADVAPKGHASYVVGFCCFCSMQVSTCERRWKVWLFDSSEIAFQVVENAMTWQFRRVIALTYGAT